MNLKKMIKEQLDGSISQGLAPLLESIHAHLEEILKELKEVNRKLK